MFTAGIFIGLGIFTILLTILLYPYFLVSRKHYLPFLAATALAITGTGIFFLGGKYHAAGYYLSDAAFGLLLVSITLANGEFTGLKLLKRQIPLAQIALTLLFLALVISGKMVIIASSEGALSIKAKIGPAYFAYCFYAALSLLAPITLLPPKLKGANKSTKRQISLFILWEAIGAIVLPIRYLGVWEHILCCALLFCCAIHICYSIMHNNPDVITRARLSKYLRNLVSAPFMMFSPGWRLLEANKSAIAFFGLEGRELKLVHISELMRFSSENNPVTGKPNEILTYDVTAKNGKRCDASFTYVYDDDQQLRSVIVAVTDETERAELIKKLEASTKQAELANIAKSTFLAKTSHEIRTPMNTILGMVELILRRNLPQPVLEDALTVKQAGVHLLSIINDVLDFSKLESGKMEIINAEYSLATLVNDVISIIRVRMSEKPIAFVANIDASTPNNLWGDEVRTRQILINLLSNAVKFTNEGYISFTINWEPKSSDMIQLTFDVEDTGAGIRREHFEDIFNNFTKFDSHRNREVEGTGLGLAISRSLAEAMEGKLNLTSVYGKGSTFTLTLPQKVRNFDAFAEIKEPDDKSVLVYEARAIYSNSIVCTIDNLGVRCKLAYDEKGFAEALEEREYSAVFVSFKLFDSAKRALEKSGKTLPLVLMTEFGEIVAEQYVSSIAMPVHSISVANTLNGIQDTGYMEGNDLYIRFIAPTANILIVDDILTNLKVAEGLILPYKTKIYTCTSGEEALNLVKTADFDMVFMDHMMPIMDGIETTKAIRELEADKYRALPIIALTANAISGMREMFLANGFNDYLPKPIDPMKLDGILERWIPKNKQKEQLKGEKAAHKPASTEWHVKGVDIEAGIKRNSNNAEAYLQILQGYAQDTITLVERLENFSKDNMEEYALLVRELKGASAAVCAYDAATQAEKLEFAVKNGEQKAILEGNETFIKTLKQLVDGINELVRDILGEKAKPSMLTPDKEKLKEFYEAVSASDKESLERILGELEGYSYVVNRDLVVWLRNHTDSLEYDKIKARLEQELRGVS